MRNDYIVRKTYYSFVLVAILSSLTATAGILIDNIIVGRYLGSEALGAMGIVGPVSLVFSAIGNICSGGGGARAAQAMGRGDREQYCLIFTTNTLFVLAVGAIFTVFGMLFAPGIAKVLGAKDGLMDPAADYLYGFFLGAIPTILLSAMMSFVRMDGSPKLPLICILVMSAANIILDLMMVHVFHLGMFGMAIATTVSYYLAVAVALTHFLKKDSTLKLVRPKGFFRDLSNTILTGLPTALNRISETVKVMLLNKMLVAYVSVAAVTALNVRTTTSNFLGAVVLGIGQAATPTIGMFFGEEDRTAMRDTLKTTLRLGLLINAALAAVLLVFPAFSAQLLGVTDKTLIHMSAMAVRLFAVGMPVQLINSVLINYYQCTKKVAMATMICVLQSLVYTLLFAYILIMPMGATGVWLAFLLAEILTLLTVALVLLIKNRKSPLSIDAVMMLEQNFGGNPRDRLEISIGNSMEEVMKISSGIYKFGKNRTLSKETLNTLSLFIEELAGNVVRHAFKPREKRWLDMTIVDKPEKLIIRIRDNGAAFDPLAYLYSVELDGYGLLLVQNLAEDITYRRNMGLNNLIIHLKKESKLS